MRASGKWTLLEPAASANSFACAFKADFTAVPPDTVSSSSSSVNENGAHSSSAGSTSSSGGGSNSGVPQSRNHHAKRPVAPQPASPCLSSWTPLPAFVDTSGGAANTVCYRLFTDASEVGGRLGKNFESAREYCGAVHPKASLASVMSQQENTWIVPAFLSPMAAFPTSCSCDGSSKTEAAARATSAAALSSGTQSARTVFLGGSFMHDGSGAGLIGSWHADQYLFNASEYATTSPSSPSWPSSTNLYYFNWGEGEPMLRYGVVGITPPPFNEYDCGNTSTLSPPPASAAGVWICHDPRSTQPFLCPYLNDGSVFPTLPPTATLDPSSEPSPGPSPSEYCLSGWSYLALTSSCYRLYPSASTATGADSPVTAAFMEEHCAQVLRGRVAVTKLDYVHAVAIQSVTESYYVGSLLSLYLESSGNGVAVPARDGRRSISVASSALLASPSLTMVLAAFTSVACAS
ncbi:hypothetical protein JIQ42_07168 [Leishmania sp. Namibia]|uniref:hypothetical protein n=1 Tax=Leishmania sp. Namibia TaxID=2802991 RepID=UPI001B76948C|nr:hypothetical protein JIQ42_07168 [Leishmania sp. Namibia]